MKSAILVAASAALVNAQAFQKTEFQSENLRAPIWMIGEYYVVT